MKYSPIYDKIIKGNHKELLLDKYLANFLENTPKDSFLIELMNKSFIINKPMDKVGGDGYWFYDNGNEVFLVVFDCMGHGPMANIMTRKYIQIIEKVIKIENFEYPSLILERIHKYLTDDFGDLGSDRLGSGADISVLSFNNSNRLLKFAGAKMDLAHISDGQLFMIKGDKLQVGEIFDRDHFYHTTEMKLPTKSPTTLFLYTDGVTDLLGGDRNKKLGRKRLAKILERSYFLPVDKARTFIEKQLNNWLGDNVQNDDILMLGITI